MNYIERNKIETIYKDDYTDFTRLSDFEVFTKDILVSLKKLNIIETKRKYEDKYAFINDENRTNPLAPLSLIIAVEDTFNEYVELEIVDKSNTDDEKSISMDNFSISNLILNSLKLSLSELGISLPTFVVIDKNSHIYQGHFYTSDYTYYKCVNPHVTIHKRWYPLEDTKEHYEERGKDENKITSKTISENESKIISENESKTTSKSESKTTIKIESKSASKSCRDIFRNSHNVCRSAKGENYVSVYKGTGFEANYHSFKFYNYFKSFTFDQLVALFSLFIYLSNLKGKNIYNINVHIKNIYLIDKPQNFSISRPIDLKNKKYNLLKRIYRQNGRQKKGYKSKVYLFKNKYELNSYNKNNYAHIYLNNIYNHIKKKRYYGRRVFLCYLSKPLNGHACKGSGIVKTENVDDHNDYRMDSRNAEITGGCIDNITDGRMDNITDGRMDSIADGRMDSIADGRMDSIADGHYGTDDIDDNDEDPHHFSDTSMLFYSCSSTYNYVLNNEKGVMKKKTTFEEINRLYNNLRCHKNMPKQDSNLYLSIYILNFINNMQHKIIGSSSNGGKTTGRSSDKNGGKCCSKRNRKNKIINMWKIRFINNDKYKGKNSYLLKNILRLYYNELLDLKKKRSENTKSYSNGILSMQNYFIQCLPLKNKEWLRDRDLAAFSGFNIEEESTRYYIDKILNNMFSTNKKRIYNWENRNVRRGYYGNSTICSACAMGMNKLISSNYNVSAFSSSFVKRENYESFYTNEILAHNNSSRITLKGACDTVNTSSTVVNNDGSCINSGVPLNNGSHLNNGSRLNNGSHLNNGSRLNNGSHLNSGSHLNNGSRLNNGSHLNNGSRLNNGCRLNSSNIYSNGNRDDDNMYDKSKGDYDRLFKMDNAHVYLFLGKNDNFIKKRDSIFRKQKQKKRKNGKGRKGEIDGKDYLNFKKKNFKEKKEEKEEKDKVEDKEKEKEEENVQQIIKDFLTIKEKYFLCHQEEKISILFFYLISHSSNIKTFYYIWNQFFDNIRNKYENNEYIFNDYLFLSYGPRNIYSYSCSILSQYIKALNISTQQFKINEIKNHLKQKKTLSFFCNDSDNSLLNYNLNFDDDPNMNENNDASTAVVTQNKSNTSSTIAKKNISKETVFPSFDLNDATTASNKKSIGNKTESSPNFELAYIKGSEECIPKSSGQYAKVEKDSTSNSVISNIVNSGNITKGGTGGGIVSLSNPILHRGQNVSNRDKNISKVSSIEHIKKCKEDANNCGGMPFPIEKVRNDVSVGKKKKKKKIDYIEFFPISFKQYGIIYN
ncbi:hypothetical protein PMALA_026480 [Plasmodium malariae]|uniref:Uncharacterized protein n=1 Tax=Plasmodium malariae TaxID=5858 RepID=A0A1A8WC04_PLAMA|nr:hypothetical protein PMALA_026480 [Plasmodium malariae]